MQENLRLLVVLLVAAAWRLTSARLFLPELGALGLEGFKVGRSQGFLFKIARLVMLLRVFVAQFIGAGVCAPRQFGNAQQFGA